MSAVFVYDKRMFFPFDKLGLSRNPFGTLSDAERRDLLIVAPAMQALLDDGFHHLQLMGQRGRGKSATLRLLIDHCQAQGKRVITESLPEGQSAFHADLQDADVFALDEAQRLNVAYRWRFFRLAKSTQLIFTSHRDLSTGFKRRGHDLTTVHVADFVTRQHFGDILNTRIAYFALDNQPFPTLSDDALDALYQHFGDNLRACEMWLYDFFQSLDSPKPITEQHLLHLTNL